MSEKEPKFEKGLRWYRNYSILGAAALAGAALALPGAHPVLEGLAWLNGVQAGGAEVLRQNHTKRQARKLGGAALKR